MTFCTKCGNELVEGAKFCPKCGMAVGSPARRLTRESSNKYKRKPMSVMTIALIAILVGAAVIVGLMSTLFFLGAWKPLVKLLVLEF